MIVDPDFPDHWKTRLLVELLDGDEVAPLYLIRLWAHCQNRRIAAFDKLPQGALKALCRYSGDAAKLETALTESGFVRREGQTLIVCGWEEYNASLIANWTNGKRGGRPRKAPENNPPETHGFSMDNPSLSHGEPIREDRIREDQIRKEESDLMESDKTRYDEMREEQTREDGERSMPAAMSPSLEEVETFAFSSLVGITHDCALKFWNDNEAVGWVHKGQPIRNWRPLLENFARSWNINEARAKEREYGPRPRRRRELRADDVSL